MITMQADLATDRCVWTYLPEGQPAGLITGYRDAGGLIVEHIVCWQGSLVAMLQVGLEDAWAQGFEHLILCVPLSHQRTDSLCRLAARLGFEEYAREHEAAWFVRYRPWTH